MCVREREKERGRYRDRERKLERVRDGDEKIDYVKQSIQYVIDIILRYIISYIYIGSQKDSILNWLGKDVLVKLYHVI